MSASEFIESLRLAGVELWADGERLCYDAPEEALTEDLLARLRAGKSEILELVRAAPIPSQPHRFPLSAAQEAFWLLNALYPGHAGGNEQFAIALQGPLEREALERAWRLVVARHGILRVRFADEAGVPWQRIADEPPAAPASLDLAAAGGDLRALATRALSAPFDLGRGPLLRPLLIRLGAGSHLLLVTVHHIVADGLSVPVIRDELAQLYGDLCAGREPDADGGRPQYSAFALRGQPSGGQLAPQLEWWRRQLDGGPARHALPRRARPPALNGAARRLAFAIDARTTARLRVLAREQGVTLFTLLLAAFRVLLVRYGGQDDVLISSPVTLRDDADTRRMVGCLVNNVVFRTPAAGDPRFTELLARERTTVLGVLEHREVPFARVIGVLDPARRPGEQPLSQIMFQFDVAPRAQSVAGVEFGIVPVPADRQSYWDLEWSLTDQGVGRGLAGHVCYATAVFEDWLIEAMPRHFTTLLEAIAAAPHERLSELRLLDGTERRRVLVEWNATAADYPRDATLHELVARQCRDTPAAVALHGEDGVVTYAELERRVAAAAARLRALGAAPGERVALSLPPAAGLVIGLLAILRSGAAVVPLDPAYPRARLEFILRDSGALLLVTAPGVAEGLTAPGVMRVEVGVLDQPGAIEPVPAGATPDSPACLLYTSGSTGGPKGAINLHRGAVNRCHWMWREHGFGPGDVFCLRTSISFVDSLWEIFGALMHGIPLALLPGAAARDPALLIPALARFGVTQLVLVPPLLRALLEHAPDLGARLPALRHLITSGEPLPPDLLATARRALPGARLLNTYGASEIWDATCCDLSTPGAAPDRVPIGRPIANARCYVLDRNLHPVPVGVPGELCVAGIGLGAGYWRQPALTAERFVADPFAGDPAARLYRSGDLARHLPDGTLECLGRLDRQVKLRGNRVEPGEIEAVLRGCAGVRDAAVVLCDADGQQRLVAYVVAATDGLDVVALQAGAAKRLPDFMLPSAWVPLARLPLTPSGKLDRDALPPPPDSPPPAVARPFADEIEARLAGLWAAVLGRAFVGPDESFFDLGGQSLLAMRLLARVASGFGVTLTLRDLFEAPTVAGLADRIRAQHDAPAAGPALRPLDRTGPLSLSWGQERLWFLDQLDPASPAYNIAWTIDIRGPLDLPRLQAALDQVVGRHESLRTTFPSREGRPVQVIASTSRVRIEFDSVSAAGIAARRDALARRPFDLAAGPLLRVTLLRLGDHAHELVVVVHHMVTDGTSNGILFNEFAACYDALCREAPPVLPQLPVQYADFAGWQRRWLEGERSRRQLEYWERKLRGAPAALELPTDFPRPAEQRFRGAWVWRSMPAQRVATLREFARRHDVTLYMLMLAVYKVLLARYSGQHDLVVGTPVSARPHADLDGVVGLFINTVALRTGTDGDPAFREFLARVRATAVDAFAHQDVPFERLVESLKPERTLARSPVFQAMFNLVPIPARSRVAGGADFRLGRLLDHGVSTFDLTLTVGEHVDGLELIFEFDTDLFRREGIARMADAYDTLLDAALRDPGKRVSRLPLLTQAEADAQHGLLTGARAQAPGAETVLPIFAERVAARGGAEAVAAGGRRLTYAGLDARANRIAHELALRGCGPGRRVGLCLPRSPDLVAALLGVLKSGAAYVPLDPDYPAARLGLMARDADLALIVTAGEAAACASGPGVPVLDLGAEEARLGRQPTTAPVTTVSPSDIAYVIYTSGSTGEAKGVAVSHASLAATFRGWEAAYGLTADDAHLQMASAAFDVFTGDWVRALLSGARLVLCPRETLADPARLRSFMVAERITVAEFVPAVVRPLITWSQRGHGDLSFMRLLIVGSDTWHAHEYRALRSLCGPRTRVVNSYGVAEATIDSTWFEGDDPGSGTVPIGRPFPHTTVRILDEHQQPVPMGVPGELYIGGAGVAQGYHGREELTAERFVPDPYGATAGARLYRTGDRARLRADGVIEFLGRLDDQVKLRGFRIEPAEVEAVLGAVAGVAGCAVTVREAVAGDARLVAWVVGRAGAALDAAGLRAAVRERLPGYMVPAAFVLLDELPLTPNGKVDRQALPAPVWGAGTGADYAAPRNAVEQTLCELYAAVLGSPGAVGIHADFFALGGHSLLATRLVSRILDVLAVELPLRALFESPTVAALGEVIVGAASAAHAMPEAFDDER